MKKTLIISLGVIFLASCAGKKNNEQDAQTAVIDSTTKTSCYDSLKDKKCCDSTTVKKEECCSKAKKEKKEETVAVTQKTSSTTIDQSKLDAAESAYDKMIAIMNAGGNNFDQIQKSRKAYQDAKNGMSEAELAKHIELMKAKRQAKIDAQK